MPKCLYCQASTPNIGALILHLATACEPYRSLVRHELELADYLAERRFQP